MVQLWQAHVHFIVSKAIAAMFHLPHIQSSPCMQNLLKQKVIVSLAADSAHKSATDVASYREGCKLWKRGVQASGSSHYEPHLVTPPVSSAKRLFRARSSPKAVKHCVTTEAR